LERFWDSVLVPRERLVRNVHSLVEVLAQSRLKSNSCRKADLMVGQNRNWQ